MNETATQQDRNCPLREKQQLGIAFPFVRFSEFFVKKTKYKKAAFSPSISFHFHKRMKPAPPSPRGKTAQACKIISMLLAWLLHTQVGLRSTGRHFNNHRFTRFQPQHVTEFNGLARDNIAGLGLISNDFSIAREVHFNS